MPGVFFIGDTHFGHSKLCLPCEEFPNRIGYRPFQDAEEMNEFISTKWNETVSPRDKVYVLGDVTLNKKYLPILSMLHGSKVLIMGNHDIYPTAEYLKYFKSVYGYRVLAKTILLSHIPVHPDSKSRYRANIHGHIHKGHVQIEIGGVKQPDPFYVNVSAEEVGYTPVLLDDVLQLVVQIHQ